MRVVVITAVSIHAVVASAALLAQDEPRFEVASIRANTSRSGVSSTRPAAGGRFTAVNVPLRNVIRYAYALSIYQTVEGAAPLLDQRFDITATSGVDWPMPRGIGPFNLAVQHLLADRFRLAVHWEKRPRAGYVLTVVREDGRLGPQLRSSTVDCATLRASRQKLPAGNEGFSPCTLYGRPRPAGDPIQGQRVRAGGHTIAEFAAAFLETTLRAPVQDRTGLEGPYDIDLTFGGGGVSARPEAVPDVRSAPPLETAIREQLGLRLEKVQVHLDTLVVDRVDAPTEN
jgi:uncharacterized protein (TIGR03435 family)